MTFLSIVICTYNNAESLKRTLEQIDACEQAGSHSVELVLVDNNSPDHTKQVSNEFESSCAIHYTYLFEGKQGLSHARNTGMNAAKGEYILFTDDDAEIPKNWISDYLSGIDRYKPDCIFSRISIIWDKGKPWWYCHYYQPYFVHLDHGSQEIVVKDYHKEFYGKNFCVKKATLVEIGGFNPELGRQGDKLLAGEETVIYRKLIDGNKLVVYLPEPSVGHRLKDREYTPENIEKLFVDGAYSSYSLSKIFAQKTIFGRPIHPLLNGLSGLIKSLIKLPCSCFNTKLKFYHRIAIKQHLTLLKLWSKNP